MAVSMPSSISDFQDVNREPASLQGVLCPRPFGHALLLATRTLE